MIPTKKNPKNSTHVFDGLFKTNSTRRFLSIKLIHVAKRNQKLRVGL